MLAVHHVKAGQGRFAMEAIATQSDDGVNVYLGGREKPHIGTVVLCQPRQSLKTEGSLSQTTSTINLMGHKDDGVGVPMAQCLCVTLEVPVVVTAGVHIAAAHADDIKALLKVAEEITCTLLELLLAESEMEEMKI